MKSSESWALDRHCVSWNFVGFSIFPGTGKSGKPLQVETPRLRISNNGTESNVCRLVEPKKSASRFSWKVVERMDENIDN